MILYSEGFESSKNLARKMVQMYRLCSEQLSQQDHYDFGMRAVKSVLVMAGALKRGNPNLNEDIVLIRALRDSNLPKFLKQDAELFRVSCIARITPYILRVWDCIKDGAYVCYYAYVLRISRYSSFLLVVPTNTGIFLRGLNLFRESRT